MIQLIQFFTPERIYAYHVPLAVALLSLTALLTIVETLRRRQ